MWFFKLNRSGKRMVNTAARGSFLRIKPPGIHPIYNYGITGNWAEKLSTSFAHDTLSTIKKWRKEKCIIWDELASW